MKAAGTEKVNLWALLEKRFPDNEYALLAEVRDKAGHSASRAADGIAMSLWPSRGLEVIGLEIKSFRSDWLRELKNPAKAENIFKYCDRWYLVTDDETVAKIDEIPAAWGWITAKGSRLVTIKEAPKADAQSLDRHFVAAMLKRACQGRVSVESISERLEAAREAGKVSERSSQTYELQRVKEELSRLKGDVKKFEDQSGIVIHENWHRKKVGEAVKFVLDGGIEVGEDRIRQMLNLAESAKKHLESGLASISNQLPIEAINQSNEL